MSDNAAEPKSSNNKRRWSYVAPEKLLQDLVSQAEMKYASNVVLLKKEVRSGL